MNAVRELFKAGTTTGATDGELLERFASRRDEGAFAALVERHGPMVLRVCRAELGDHHDALDAFQAVFLVLARKGDSLWVGDSLGPWLHRVARRASGRARRASLRRSAAERRAAESARTATEPSPTPDRDETAAVIHGEVDRLPEPFRAAVVLCDLEGLTCDEAAARLGSLPGTVASRLSRGRGKLRDRLRRRGLDPGGPLAITPAALPAGLADATASAAARFVALSSSAAPTGAAVILALGVLRAMTWRSWWKSAATALALAASTSGVVAFAARGGGPVQEPTAKAEAPQVETVAVGPMTHTSEIRASGLLYATNREPLKSPSVAYVMSSLPQGARVKKGDVVAEFSASELQKKLPDLEMAVENARAEVAKAQGSRALADKALEEYVRGTSGTEKLALSSEIRLAEQGLTQSKKSVETAKNARDTSHRQLQKLGEKATPADILADLQFDDRLTIAERELSRSQGALEQAFQKLDTFEKYTKPKEMLRFQTEIEAAAEKANAVGLTLRFAAEQLDAVKRQIDARVIRSPIDGVVTWSAGSQPPGPRSTLEPGVIAHVQGADGRLVAKVTVWAKTAAFIRPGQPAKVTRSDDFGASNNEKPVPFVVDGVVESVLDDPIGSNQYSVTIKLPDRLPNPKPFLFQVGTPVQVEITGGLPEGTLGIPTKALVWYDGAYHVGVRKTEGAIEWREIVPGVNVDEATEVRSGLKPGDAVVVDPEPFLSDDQRRRISIAPPPPPFPQERPEFQ